MGSSYGHETADHVRPRCAAGGIAATRASRQPVASEEREHMGVTSIRHVDNHTAKSIVVDNRENPNNNFTVPAGDGHEGEMWIPWCDDAGSFTTKRIEFRIESTGKTYYIWQ